MLLINKERMIEEFFSIIIENPQGGWFPISMKKNEDISEFHRVLQNSNLAGSIVWTEKNGNSMEDVGTRYERF